MAITYFYNKVKYQPYLVSVSITMILAVAIKGYFHSNTISCNKVALAV